jgi:hypothetical protein
VIVDAQNLVATGQQTFRESGADKAGRASNEDAHRSFLKEGLYIV